MQSISLIRDEITDEVRVEERECDPDFLFACAPMLIYYIVTTLCKDKAEADIVMTSIVKVSSRYINKLFEEGVEGNADDKDKKDEKKKD